MEGCRARNGARLWQLEEKWKHSPLLGGRVSNFGSVSSGEDAFDPQIADVWNIAIQLIRATRDKIGGVPA